MKKMCQCENRVVLNDGKYFFCFLCFRTIPKFRERKKVIVPSNVSGRGHVRYKVRMRDDFTCQDCGSIRTPDMARQQNKRLFDVHHLNGLCGKKSRGYDKVSEMDNLITLCHKCHYNRPEHRCKSKDWSKVKI